MKTTVVFLMTAALAMTACSRLTDDGVRFDGQKYRIKANKVSKEDRASFDVQVGSSAATLEGAREAAAYGGVEYCIKQYGTSTIAWAVDPAEAQLIDGDTLIAQGTCKP